MCNIQTCFIDCYLAYIVPPEANKLSPIWNHFFAIFLWNIRPHINIKLLNRTKLSISSSKWVSQKLVLLIHISLRNILQPGLGICLQNKHRTPIYFTKKALRIITGVHPRSPSEPLFCQLKFLNCENISKYLVGRLMYRVYHEELTTLQFLFIKNSDIHMHGTRQRGHYHIPLCRTNLGKSSLRYFGALLWNKVLNADINPNVSDFIFSRNLKTAICNNLL